MAEWEKEGRETTKKEKKKLGRVASFLPTSNLIFLMLRPRNSSLFIGGGRGKFCL